MKVIANIVKGFLLKFISNEQFAFLKQRYIHEPIVIAQEVLPYSKWIELKLMIELIGR